MQRVTGVESNYSVLLGGQMRDRALVLDTNAYRQLQRLLQRGVWEIGALRDQERRKNLDPYANLYVLMELAAHLVDENDPHGTECRGALTAMYQHCSTDDGHQMRLLADSESLMMHALFGRVSPSHENNTERLSRLAQAVASAPSGPLSQQIRTACRQVSQRVSEVEHRFIEDMRALVRKLNPAAAAWTPFESSDAAEKAAALATVRNENFPSAISMSQVLRAHSLLGIPPDNLEFDGMVKRIQPTIGIYIALYREILERIVNTGCDISKPKRSNWIVTAPPTPSLNG